MNNVIKFKPNKTITMSLNEVIGHRQALKYKLWQHIEMKPQHQQNIGYVERLEREIAECDILIKNYTFVTGRAA
jgi:hypothetical protein